MSISEQPIIPVCCHCKYNSGTCDRPECNHPQGPRLHLNKWRDIDLIVVSRKFKGRQAHEDMMKLWHATEKTDSRIEPIACGDKEWEKDDWLLPILENYNTPARREGIRIEA